MKDNGKSTLVEIRKFLNLSLKDVSTMMNVPIRTLRKYEQTPNKAPVHVVVAMAGIYKVKIDEIAIK